ncbi:MAG: glycine betaine ABC transporter substrate-binding protein [Planctomycetota bacterium]
MKTSLLLCLLACPLLLLAGCTDRSAQPSITVGSKHFTEQEILGEMIAILVEENTDIRVNRKLNLGGTMLCFNGLRSGDLDVYVEYTGTGLVNILEREVVTDPDKAYQIVKDTFAEKYGLTWLGPLGFNNTYTLTMRRAHAEELEVETISDLAAHIRRGGEVAAAFDAEFFTRPDGYPGLQKHYGFEFPDRPKQMDPGLMYRTIADEGVDVIDGFATDGRIPAYGLVTLEDDKGFFPPYYAAPLVRRDTLKRHPELEALLNKLAGTISDETMQKLNYEVDENGRKAADVAREFLVSQGLLQAE